uniref:Uncharacterized protein n=1 Tax=Oryza rufipogon TaxID=4529 RepID=A0A0E0N0B3_ORYRU
MVSSRGGGGGGWPLGGRVGKLPAASRRGDRRATPRTGKTRRDFCCFDMISVLLGWQLFIGHWGAGCTRVHEDWEASEILMLSVEDPQEGKDAGG